MAPPPLFKPQQSLPILWQSPQFIVINKPAGLASHPGSHTRDSVETRLVPQKRGGPWLAHRLDTDTAGCLLIARRKKALMSVQHAFTRRKPHKTYWAIVNGLPSRSQGRITLPLRRCSHQGRWWMQTDEKVSKDAQPAETLWRLIGHHDTYSVLELTLLTGRTHQARLHCASMGHPILGDPLYGPTPSSHTPMQLLARSFEVTLEDTHISAIAPPPPHMTRFLQPIPHLL